MLISDAWVIETVKGFQILLVSIPTQPQRPVVPTFPEEQAALIEEEIHSPLMKGAIVKAPDCMRFFSNLFLVSKNGQMKPAINLKCLNQWVATEHFKMEGTSTFHDLLRPRDWMVKVDLKVTYFTVPIHPNHQKNLRFTVKGVDYQFTCLPCAPWIFTKAMKLVMTLLWFWGIKIIIYIDDMLEQRHQNLCRNTWIPFLALSSLWALSPTSRNQF